MQQNFEGIQGYLNKLAGETAQILAAPQWVSPTLGGGWAASRTVQYTKFAGVVYIRGQLSTLAASGTTLFTLPVGFRPGTVGRYLGSTGSGSYPSAVVIDTTGVIQPFYSAGTTISFDGICFIAEG